MCRMGMERRGIAETLPEGVPYPLKIPCCGKQGLKRAGREGITEAIHIKESRPSWPSKISEKFQVESDKEM